MAKRHTLRRGLSPDTSLVEAFANLRSDYNAAKTSRYTRKRTGLAISGSGADYHYRSELGFFQMMEYARDIDRNDMVVGQGITRLIDNVIQDGFKLDPNTGDADADKLLIDRWNSWAMDPDQCHSAGELDFHSMEILALRHTIVDGDVLFLPLENGTLEPVEAHRLRTPSNTTRNVVLGVLMDGQRRRLEYWLTKDDVNPRQIVSKVSQMKRYPVRDDLGHRQVFHIYNPRRFSQTRGITHMAPISDPVGMHDDIQFATLVQRQIASCYAIIHETEGGVSTPSANQTGEVTKETLADGSTRTVEGIAPGMHYYAVDGEKLKGFAPNIPSPQFFPHATLILTFIAINLNLPLAVLMLDPSKTNFSGWRGAMDQARLSWTSMQNWLSTYLHRRTYVWKLRQWLADGSDVQFQKMVAKLESENHDLFRHRWKLPTWKYIEPLKDASADLLRVRNAMISPRRMQAERGREWDEVYAEIVEDNSKAIREAKTEAVLVNKDFDDGHPISWRDLLSLPTPDGISIRVSSDTEHEESGANVDDN